MKAKHLLAIIAAAATTLAACQKSEDLGPEKVEIDSEAGVEIPKEGGELTIKLTATVDWALQGYDSAVQQWLSISPESGKASADAQTIAIKVLPNEGTDRSANIVFYGNILCKAPLTITQKGAIDGGEKGAEPTSATKVSIKEFLAKPVNTTDWYELSGKIISISGAAYGNFTIEDETGSVYVYGLVKAWADGKNDQSFASIGLKETDVVTMWTLRSEYNGTPQAGGSSAPAIYKSHEAGTGVTYPEGSVILKFPDDNSESNKISSYAKTWTAKIGANEFTIANFNNNKWDNWSYIKCGTKNGDSKASIFTATPIAAKLAKLQVSVDAISTDYVNSVTFNVYSDANKSATVLSKAVEDFKTGIVEISIDADKQAAGLCYELVFDCKQSKSNGVVTISKVVYFAAE